MSDVTKAVFPSYAREDIAAARRIAEALRTSGVEVWFDQEELRGGEGWDAKMATARGAPTLNVEHLINAERRSARTWVDDKRAFHLKVQSSTFDVHSGPKS